MLRPNDCTALARTVKSIYSKNHEGARQHLSAFEEQILRQTELTLCEELAIALGESEDKGAHTAQTRTRDWQIRIVCRSRFASACFTAVLLAPNGF